MEIQLLYEKRFIEDLKALSVKDKNLIRKRLLWLAENALKTNHY
jgi:mRNA-degrading endonuclease RelE of RelBE toxin-antitoxin system